jgi:hypothetical protein
MNKIQFALILVALFSPSCAHANESSKSKAPSSGLNIGITSEAANSDFLVCHKQSPKDWMCFGYEEFQKHLAKKKMGQDAPSLGFKPHPKTFEL